MHRGHIQHEFLPSNTTADEIQQTIEAGQ
jgi:hypothetical protein